MLEPGEALAMYHREKHQEGFLVLAGEAVLVVEAEQRTLHAWDFFHYPGGTAHAIVGAGDGPAVLLAVGARGGRKGIVYLAEATARRLGAAVATRTTSSAEAYARFPPSQRCSYEEGLLPRL